MERERPAVLAHPLLFDPCDMVREEKEIQEITEFFQKTPPFNRLDGETIEHTARRVSIEFYPKGLAILRQNGPPCEALHLVKRGEVKVFVQDEQGDEILIDYRGDGDSFGFVSLLSGDKSRANVVALQDTVCYVLPKENLLDLLNRKTSLRDFFMRSFFWNFIDKTYEDIKSRAFPFGEGDKLLFTTAVRELVSRDVVTASADITVREAAELMTAQRISSVILVDGHDVPVGIVTDRDLREKVVARGLGYDHSVSSVMSPPLIRVDGGEASFEALLRMIRYNIHHLLVVEGGILTGVVTNHDFMMLQGTSPLSIVKSIKSQCSIDGLRPMGERIHRITAMLIRNGVRARQATRLITELGDQLVERLAELVTEELGPPPAPMAVALYGSEGRKEQTFKAPIDCLILTGTQEGSPLPPNVRSYMDRFVSRLKQEMTGCGLPFFAHHPMTGGLPYDTPTGWEERFYTSLKKGEIHEAAKLLDLRHLWGVERLSAGLLERLRLAVRKDRGVFLKLLSGPVSSRPGRGFLRQLIGSWPGDEDGRLHIKERALKPIVEGVRLLAVERDIRTVNTVERIQRLSEEDRLNQRLYEDVRLVYEFLMQLRFEDQVYKLDSREPADDVVDTTRLTQLELKTLRDAFTVIERFQNVLRNIAETTPAIMRSGIS